MGTIQGAMNSIIASTAAAAVSTKADIEKRSEDRVQELVNKYNKLVEEKLEEKTKDLMTV